MRKEACTTAHFFLVLAAFAIGVALTACERPATDGVPRSFDRIYSAYSEKPVEVTNPELNAELRAEQYGKLRSRQIESLQNALFPIPEEKTPSKTPWKNGVSGHERPELFDVICENLDQFQTMTWALREMDAAGGVYNISWEELGITETGARIIYHFIGLETAQYMIAMIREVPRSLRKHVEPCYRGEGSWNFSNELDEFDRLVEILDAITPSEQELGISKDYLRGILILQLMIHVNELESAAEDGYIGQDDALACLTFIAEDAAKIWGIPMSLLHMSPQNVTAVRELRDTIPLGCREEVNLTLMR